jgi:DNA-binding CsgD family transcriptional regulator
LATDEEQILELIHRNRIAVWTQDFALYQSCFVQQPYTSRWNASHLSGIFTLVGWDEISTRVRHIFRNDPSSKILANAYDTTVENLMLRVDGDMAWATYEQRYPGIPNPYHHRGQTREARVFERHDGEWRIALLVFMDEDASRPDQPMLQLSGDAAVLWQSAAATAALALEDDLVIRAGKLRARDRKTDRQLQAAIGWAAARDVGYAPGRGALPVVQEAGEGLPAKVWWVIAESGKIWFALTDARLNDTRLAGAAAVYGLSPVQREVARRIADGASLNEIAVDLDISPHTVRTHLDRVYEKTGVRTQTALVRVLLTAIAPV